MEKKTSSKLDENDGGREEHKEEQEGEEEIEAVELVLFQVSECYVYLIPPRKSAASYRADEWNVNKWAWEGTLKIISKGEECIIKLEDKTTGELYAQAFLRNGELHPVESVIDSSRYFVLRVEENIGGRVRHAFIGIGFRERTEAYDFQAALHDHMKYLNKKKTAEEMEQQYQKTASVDYSLKEGETIVLQLKNKGGSSVKSRFFEQGLNNLSLEDKTTKKEPSMICLKPPPPPPAPLSPVNAVQKSPQKFPTNFSLEGTTKDEASLHSTKEHKSTESSSPVNQCSEDAPEDDFGDFQAAG
ncbi:Adaptin ear-binding coat-associated protein 1 NECAP-1 [Macleaya cordata]|uniref:Adaptin ear-binding coat-associated protein 1 NECAP-1 n=1 Tax=Macleaya cordata TaxID=56857 RepID=A0A200QFC0_MACCD|nr:Adaptin ear-binding coat-associated protein 1 NECAP-1 [Macleaya cordata]